MLLCLQGLVTEALQYTIPQQVAGILWVFFTRPSVSTTVAFFLNFVDVHVIPFKQPQRISGSFVGNIRKQYNVDLCIWKINLSNNLLLYINMSLIYRQND